MIFPPSFSLPRTPVQVPLWPLRGPAPRPSLGPKPSPVSPYGVEPKMIAPAHGYRLFIWDRSPSIVAYARDLDNNHLFFLLRTDTRTLLLLGGMGQYPAHDFPTQLLSAVDPGPSAIPPLVSKGSAFPPSTGGRLPGFMPRSCRGPSLFSVIGS